MKAFLLISLIYINAWSIRPDRDKITDTSIRDAIEISHIKLTDEQREYIRIKSDAFKLLGISEKEYNIMIEKINFHDTMRKEFMSDIMYFLTS